MNWDWIFDWDAGGGPWGRRGREWRGPRRGFFRSGEVRLALLSLLEEQPGHGYDLMGRLEERSGGLYRASPGTVYPVLQQLDDEGLVLSREADGKRVYEITDTGRAELDRERETVDRIWRRAGKWREWGCHMGPETVEVGVALGRLTKAAFEAAGRGPEDAGRRVAEVLDRTRRELEELAYAPSSSRSTSS